MVGWIGLILLMIGYTTLLTKYSLYFYPINTVASFILTIHAIVLGDMPFFLVNAWITVILGLGWYKRRKDF